MTKPTTSTGQRYADNPPGSLNEWNAAILAIEAEARSTPAEALDTSLKEARSIIRQLSNALMWCDTRYRQTLEGKPVRDVTELRHEIVSVLDASGRFLDARLSVESDR